MQLLVLPELRHMLTTFHNFFFTVKFRNELQKKLELKLPSPLKSVAYLQFSHIYNILYYSVTTDLS